MFWGHLFGTFILFIYLAFSFFTNDIDRVIPLSPIDCITSVAFGLGQAIIYYFLYTGFRKGELVILAPLFSSFAALTAIGAFIFFGEPYSYLQLLIIATILCGVWMLNMQSFKGFVRTFLFYDTPGFGEVAFATVLAGLWTLLWSHTVEQHETSTYTFLMYASMTSFILVYAVSRKIPLRIKQHSNWRNFFLVGLCEIVAYIGVSIGYAKTNDTSTVAVISGAFSLPTIILSRIFLKEKPLLIQTVGSVVVILGVIVLTLLKSNP